MKLKSTPIEDYKVSGATIYVKREDMCVPDGWPPFSKMRGLVAYLTRRKQEGLREVAYVETAVSMAGWGVAMASQALGLKAIIFDPQYKDVEKWNRASHKYLEFHREQWKKAGAEIIPQKAGRAKVNWYTAARYLREQESEAELLPLGISLNETIEETAAEWQRTMEEIRPGTTVCCIGSGTIFAGLMKGWKVGQGNLIGVQTREGASVQWTLDKLHSKVGMHTGGLLPCPIPIEIIPSVWKYAFASRISVPFPCHPYYDAKAWEWLTTRLRQNKPLPRPILFWNIGRSPF